mmetsp:Transcript_40609/g.60217  ORF Transcript_40609/g.60217 Transcript_40609/m.60217 type:complete len:189 (+) Transcript_40609:526-1092(+)
MIGKSVGALVVLDKVLHISYVLLRSDLYKLLGVSAIALVGVEAFTLVYDNLLSALSSEWAEIGVLTVAWAVHEVCRQEVLVQFGVEVSLEEFTEVGVATVGHRYSEPGERWESFLNLSDDGMNQYRAEVTLGDFEVDCTYVRLSSLIELSVAAFCGTEWGRRLVQSLPKETISENPSTDKAVNEWIPA